MLAVRKTRVAGAAVALLLGASMAMLVVTAGCPAPSFGPCSLRCGEAAQCPSGYSCGGDGYCYERVPDDDEQLCSAGHDAGKGARLDAGYDAGGTQPDAAASDLADAAPEEICDDGEDNSDNGLIDCADPACTDDDACCGGDFSCGPGEFCQDGVCVPAPDAG